MSLAVRPQVGWRSTINSAVGKRSVCGLRCSTPLIKVTTRMHAVPCLAQAESASVSGHTSRRTLLQTLGTAAAGTLAAQLAPVFAALAAEGITTVFVAGATGNTGRRVVQQLRGAGYNVRAGVRDLKKAQSLGLAADANVSLVEFDLVKGASKLADAIGDAQAVICAVGNNGLNPSGYTQVDEIGTKALVDAATSRGVAKFILVSSLLTNAPAIGQKDNPNYKFLNIFGGVLDHKLVAEKYLKASGLDYTIVRPGGLSNEPESAIGNLIAKPEDSLFGLETDPGRQISRDTVAAVTVAALTQPRATNKVVEVVASLTAPCLPPDQWFP